MKHLYSLVVSLAVLLFPFAAKAVNITVVIDNPAAVEAKVLTDNLYDDEPTGYTVELTAGANVITAESGNQIKIIGKPGFIIMDCLHASSYGEYNESPSNNTINIYCYDSYDGDSYTITTCPESEFRTSHFQLYIDNPEKATLSYSGTYFRPEVKEGWNNLSFNADKEYALDISTGGYNIEFYKVLQNGEPVSFSWGRYMVYLRGGDKIEVYTQYPDVDCPVHFTFENEGTESFVSRVTVDNEEVAPEKYLASNFSVKAGQRIRIEGNTTDYSYESYGAFSVNGETTAFYSSYEGMVVDETTFHFDVTPYETFTKIIEVEGIEHMTFYKGYPSEESIYQLVEGRNEVMFNEANTLVNVILDAGYKLAEFKDGDIDYTESYNSYNTNISVQKEGVLTIKVEELVFDKQFVVYVDDINAATYYFSFVNAGRESYNLKNGYNTVKYTTGYTPFSASWYGADFNYLFLNDERQVGNYGGYTSYDLYVEDGDVVKIYLASEPQPFAITFENQATVDVTVTRDLITPVTSLDGSIDVLPGTQINIAATDADKTLSVKVGNADAVITDSYEFTVDEATTVVIADGRSSVDNIAVSNDAEKAVYNLQGIRINKEFNELPAGIYIVNGTKVIKK